MPTLVIKSFPAELHARLRQAATAHRRSVTQETIHLIESALQEPLPAKAEHVAPVQNYWANPTLLPEYAALMASGRLRSDTDSTVGLSEERDAR